MGLRFLFIVRFVSQLLRNTFFGRRGDDAGLGLWVVLNMSAGPSTSPQVAQTDSGGGVAARLLPIYSAPVLINQR